MLMKTLSIIVLTYNHQDFIRQNLEGIFMQKVNFPIELIICDDCSPDNTDTAIRSLLQNAPPYITVKYTRHENNRGATPNFYFALQQVTGDYIAFCEGDDYWTHDGKLQAQYCFLESHPEYALVFHQAMNASPYPEINGSPFSSVEDRDYSPLEIYRHWVVHTATVMMRAEVLKSTAFLNTLKDPNLQYFDTVLFLAASTVGKIRGLKNCWSAYRRHDAGLSFGAVNYKRDLNHNRLDEIIGNFHGGKIKEHADWQIFSRSRIDFISALKKGRTQTALQNLKWIIKKHRNLRVYLFKKLKNG